MRKPEEQELAKLEGRMLDLLTDLARLRIRISKAIPSETTKNQSDLAQDLIEPSLAADEQLDLPQDLIEVADAAELAHRPHDTVRLWCRENKMDVGGFSMRLRGRWFVSRRLFVKFLRDEL